MVKCDVDTQEEDHYIHRCDRLPVLFTRPIAEEDSSSRVTYMRWGYYKLKQDSPSHIVHLNNVLNNVRFHNKVVC